MDAMDAVWTFLSRATPYWPIARKWSHFVSNAVSGYLIEMKASARHVSQAPNRVGGLCELRPALLFQ